MSKRYDAQRVEADVQKYWSEKRSFDASDSLEDQKFYCLSMFPYPSGRLHMGHVRNYTLGDVIARFQRLKGKNVIHPMGWDAFGLPAENAAIKNGIPPSDWTRSNINYMREQMKRLGFSFDWSREFATCDSEYYRWEQWLFLKLLEKGVAYRKTATVNWDPVDQTVLANEQVVDGMGWRSGAPVERREMDQWFMRITDYAEELLTSLDELPGWPESVKSMQRNWIGRSRGVEVDFSISDSTNSDDSLKVFTTRPDTLLGVTYLAVAPEHPIANEVAQENSEVAKFIRECQSNSTAEADFATMEKKGIASGLYATHPLTEEKLPIWIANFVLMDYGSGAVMAVPGHDQRDWEFARKYQLEVKQVIDSADDEVVDLEKQAFISPGRLMDSGRFSGLSSAEAFEEILSELVNLGRGREQINFRLRDWGVSRQRYWGCPIPVIHCDSCGVVGVPEEDLPVVLPTEVKFQGVRSPLLDMEDFLQVACPKCGKQARRETDTFDTFMESSWYYARFASPDSSSMVDPRVNYWSPVDHYVGGIEHAILHLLYARFYFKLMRDEGLVEADEPFENLMMLGMVLQGGKKMSKSAGDAGDPQKLLDRYGADSVRLAMMFAAPPEQSFEWSEAGLDGATRFLRRLWSLVHDRKDVFSKEIGDVDVVNESALELRRQTHELIAKAEDDFGRRLQFNTVVSSVMELVNSVSRFDLRNDHDHSVVREALEAILIVISPIAPHIAHELWTSMTDREEIKRGDWPQLDSTALQRSTMPLAVQVNGKLRASINISSALDKEAIFSEALKDANVARHVEGKTIRKQIYVPDRLVNFVVG